MVAPALYAKDKSSAAVVEIRVIDPRRPTPRKVPSIALRK
jgi:hypothetical protein